MTPQEAQALVEQHGGIRAAARATDMTYSTFWARLNPERAARHSRRATRRYRNNLSGVAYSHLLLRNRRWRAMRRMAERNERRRRGAL